MPSAFCKTLRRSVDAPSSVAPFLVVGSQAKVQRAVLFPVLVETTPRNVSMLTFVQPRNGPAWEELPATYPRPLCLGVEHSNLQHAEDRTRTSRRKEESVLRAGYAHLDTPYRDVSRLTSGIDPSRPRVQRLNIWRGKNELVQDRCAGDNV